MPWLQDGSLDNSDFYVFSPGLSAGIAAPPDDRIPEDRALIKFVVASPIYDDNGDVRYTLAMEVSLYQL